ncbi:hypothetical protein SAMN05192588_2902 [Nonlabens sp. Hel1_33_55]|uniref:hypothetical protein n=1 Tax=Nonlabens sp. Hel1_33_55 TaxID=1336802 RepID=UPI000875E4A8|nr:hypothetical protein [Nonlabens sp. Hel1_33_55]SCY43978.1 hypothetical protein SAMN05192588_2902 [Nonlabens sp. Hel1_33_55]
MKNIICLFLLTATLVSCGSKKNANEVSRDFNIEIVSVIDNDVKLKCTQGCAWTELSFTVNNYQPQGVDAYGMTSNTVNTLADVSDNLPDFKFTVAKTDNGLNLERIRDTGWNKLSFSCRSECNQRIDYEGTL